MSAGPIRFFLLFLFVVAGIAGQAQTYLVFYKNSFRYTRYQVGDIISFKLKTHPEKITDQIRGFEDSLIVFQLYKVNPKEITDMYPDAKTRNWFFMKYKWEKLLPFLGGGYILLELINTGQVPNDVLITGGALIGAGLIARAVIPRTIKIKGKRKLRLVKF